MANSRNPINYPPMYWELLMDFSKSSDPVEFEEEEKKDAHYTQIQYHAFIRALEYAGAKALKAKDFDTANRYAEEARLARTRKCSLTQREDGVWLVRFTLRNDEARIQRMLAKLHERQRARGDYETLTPEAPKWKPTELPDYFKPSEGEGYNIEIAAERQAGNQSEIEASETTLNDEDKASKN